MKYQHEDTEDADEVTMIDDAPHWSSARKSLVRAKAPMEIPSIVKRSAKGTQPPRFVDQVPTAVAPSPRAQRAAQGTPPPPIVTRTPRFADVATTVAPPRVQHSSPEMKTGAMPPLPPRLPPAVQRSATPLVPLPAVAPPPVQSPSSLFMLPFYAQPEAQYGMETERVEPLPMTSLRPSWEEVLVRVWQRFAAPICGGIAGLIFVVGYLAYSSQGARAIATSAAPAAPIVMPAEVAVVMPIEEAPISPAALAQPTVSEVHVEKPAKASKRPAKRVVASSSKRRPVRLNDTTPLGDLRPSRR